MYSKFDWLQLFADGTGDGAAASGVNSPADAGQDTGVNNSVAAGQKEQTQADRLRELGVPAEKLKRAKYNEKATKQPEVAGQAAAVDNSEAKIEDAPKRMTWQEIMDDPEYNEEMRKVVAARTAKSKQATESLEKLAPVMQLLSKKYGVAADDYDAISKAVVDDDEYYEEKAMQMGVSTDVVKQLESAERATRQAEEEKQRFINEQKLQEHIAKLNAQAIELSKRYPDFDLRRELDNPVFRRMTAPDQIFSLEDAYEFVHRKEIQENIRRQSAQAVSNAIQSNKNRPAEGGASKSNNASVQTFDYRNATREQREALKARIRAGEKIYPGQF